MTKTDVRRAWGKVGDELVGLGLKLKLHAEAEFAEDDDEEEDLKTALELVASIFSDTFDAAENAVRDVAVREDASDATRALLDAVTTTVGEVKRNLPSVGAHTNTNNECC